MITLENDLCYVFTLLVIRSFLFVRRILKCFGGERDTCRILGASGTRWAGNLSSKASFPDEGKLMDAEDQCGVSPQDVEGCNPKRLCMPRGHCDVP